MATTTTTPHQHLFTHHPFTAVAAPPPGTDHLNMINLRDVVFFSPPPPLHHQPPPPPAAAVGLGVSIFPLLPCLPTTSTATTAIPSDAATTLDFQVHPEPQTVRHGNDNAASNIWSFSRKDAFSIGRQGESNQSFGGRGTMLKVCRDCGNRAKKECVHRRCRTCCRSHGYDCPTHLKSTWVPAAKRRERQHQHDHHSQSQSQSQSQAFVAGSSSSFPSGIAKRQRVDNASAAAAGSSTSNAATPRSFDTISCPQDANFKRSLPGKVRAPAVFRCIRVTAISDNAAEIVYQTTVTISGHVFKGFLYDQGTKNAISCASESKFDEGARNRANDASLVADQTVLAFPEISGRRVKLVKNRNPSN